MKRSLALVLFIAVSICASNHLVCQIFDSSEQFYQQYCDNYEGLLSENCLSDTNATIESSQVNQLKIGGCDPEIVLDLIKRFQQNLRALDISYSGYKNLDWFNLTLNQLQIFNASHNGLQNLRLFFRSKFPEIIEIDLSYNNLSRVNFGLEELKKLRKLHLSHNNITTYVAMTNFPLKSIEYIDLKSNHIEFLLSVPYEQINNLKVLHLDENPYYSVDFKLLDSRFYGRLTSLFISWKNLKNFSGLCGIDCQDRRMRIVRTNGTSEGIFITSNGAYEMHCKDKCFENVSDFDAGRNNFQNGYEVLQNIGSNVYFVNLNGNFIGKLSTNAFVRFTKIKTLELSGTNLTWFDFHMLWNQRNTLYHVDLSKNNLKQINGILSLRNYGFASLIMGGNRIENAFEIFEYLNPSIEFLDLSGGNIVGKVNVTTFQRLIQLQRLNLSNTNLILPDSDPFKVLRNLKVLDLSHNNLENLNFSILAASLYNLTELSLDGCRINDIFTVIEHLGSNILKLDLSENTIHGINGQIFQKLQNLVELKLRGLSLQTFDLYVLKNQHHLQFLDISNNKLKTIDFKSFPLNDHIHINLEENDLTELTNLQKRYSRWRWTKLELANNQFPCLYLKQLKEDYDWEIILVGDSWQQKDNRDCRAAIESIKGFVMIVYDTIKFW